ncbi:MAG: CarD family transcriptional regulator, partial [Dolichospermum sp.]
MAFSSIVRALSRSLLTAELITKLNKQQELRLNGISRLPKGLIASALANYEDQNLCVVCATLEEAGRVFAQMEAMGWKTVHFYPTSEAAPYEPFDPENELSWGQMQVLGQSSVVSGQLQKQKTAIIATVGALQPHLPPPEAFKSFCVTLEKGMEFDLDGFGEKITILGYERVPLVETEGQWSRRGDIVDVFPVSSELPVRLEWFGDEIEQIREFDPSTQRSALDKIEKVTLTPTSFAPIILDGLKNLSNVETFHGTSLQELGTLEGSRRFLGLAFTKPASLIDYLPKNTFVVIDEPEQCYAHSDRWLENANGQWSVVSGQLSVELPKIHRNFNDCLAEISNFKKLYLSELSEENSGLNLASRPLPVTPHQFAKLGETIRKERERNFAIWIISAQPSRSVSLLQEHDCPAQFIPNPRDYQAIDKLQINHTPIALKYSGLAELEGFILPSFRLVIVTDREFYGQHSLANFGYVRKRRQATSKQIDLNKLRPGDFVVHRSHGIGKFIKLESLTINEETRDYLVVQYADGLLRVAADQVGSLS